MDKPLVEEIVSLLTKPATRSYSRNVLSLLRLWICQGKQRNARNRRQKDQELEDALWKARREAATYRFLDQSPCLHRMGRSEDAALRTVYLEFILGFHRRARLPLTSIHLTLYLCV